MTYSNTLPRLNQSRMYEIARRSSPNAGNRSSPSRVNPTSSLPSTNPPAELEAFLPRGGDHLVVGELHQFIEPQGDAVSLDEYDDREHLELVMPFTVCASAGGPYDDDAFVAGFSAGTIDARLAPRTIAATTEMFRSDLLPQLDLIAMRYGYRLDVLAEPEDGWAHVGFTRIESQEAARAQ